MVRFNVDVSPAFKSSGCPFSKLGSDAVDSQTLVSMLGAIPSNHPSCPLSAISPTLRQTRSTLSTWIGLFQSIRLDLFSHVESSGGDDILLASELKNGTASVHEKAHKLNFISKFLKGSAEKFPPGIYLKLLVSLFHIYSALERGLEKNSTHPLVDPIYFPHELNRSDALTEDIKFYASRLDYSSEKISEMLEAPSEATRAYIDRLNEISNTNPGLLVAHSYTRYLGDLSGGQIMGRRAKHLYSLPDTTVKDGIKCHPGVQFYNFDNLGTNPSEFKNSYRQCLDSIPIHREEDAKLLVEEAVYAFSLIMDVYKELDSQLPVETIERFDKSYVSWFPAHTDRHSIARVSLLLLCCMFVASYFISFFSKNQS